MDRQSIWRAANLPAEAVKENLRSQAALPIVLLSVAGNRAARAKLHSELPQVYANAAEDPEMAFAQRYKAAAMVRTLESAGVLSKGNPGLGAPLVHKSELYLIDESNRRMLALSEALGGKEVYKTKEDKGPLAKSVPVVYKRQLMEGPKEVGEEFKLLGASGPLKGTDGGSGLGVGVWASQTESGKPKTLAVFYAGSARAVDWVHDLKNLAGEDTVQYEAGKKFLREKLKELMKTPPELRPSELVVGGHSLGGGIALQAYGDPENYAMIKALRSQGMAVKVVTRNPAALPFAKAREFAETVGQSGAADIVSFVNKGELVSSTGALPGHIVENGLSLGQASARYGQETRVAAMAAEESLMDKMGVKGTSQWRLLRGARAAADGAGNIAGLLAAPFAAAGYWAVGKVARHMDGNLSEVSRFAAMDGRVAEKAYREVAHEPLACSEAPFKVAYDSRFGVPEVDKGAAGQQAQGAFVPLTQENLDKWRQTRGEAPAGKEARAKAPYKEGPAARGSA